MHPTWSHSFALGRRSWTESSSSAKISSTPRDHHPPIHNICKFLLPNPRDILVQNGAGFQQRLQAALDVLHRPVADRTRQALLVALRIQPDFVLADAEPNVIRLIHIRLDPQQRLV